MFHWTEASCRLWSLGRSSLRVKGVIGAQTFYFCMFFFSCDNLFQNVDISLCMSLLKAVVSFYMTICSHTNSLASSIRCRAMFQLWILICQRDIFYRAFKPHIDNEQWQLLAAGYKCCSSSYSSNDKHNVFGNSFKILFVLVTNDHFATPASKFPTMITYDGYACVQISIIWQVTKREGERRCRGDRETAFSSTRDRKGKK